MTNQDGNEQHDHRDQFGRDRAKQPGHSGHPGGPGHPGERPIEPDHPMMLDGGCAPGDVTIMVRCMMEELLQIGTPIEQLRRMTRDPFYQALYSARLAMGDTRMDGLLERTLARIGQHRHRTVEHRGDVQAATLTVNAT